MKLVHNETIFETMSEIQNEIDDIVYDLNLALDELNDTLETGDSDDQERWVRKAIELIKGVKEKLYKD
jgi:hypothetical protein